MLNTRNPTQARQLLMEIRVIDALLVASIPFYIVWACKKPTHGSEFVFIRSKSAHSTTTYFSFFFSRRFVVSIYHCRGDDHYFIHFSSPFFFYLLIHQQLQRVSVYVPNACDSRMSILWGDLLRFKNIITQ